MTNLLNVEGKEYTVATVAAKQFGYTKDYLLLLIKDKKIDGRKVGNRWYVHLPEAEAFFKNAELRKRERRKQISLERKTELKRHDRTRFTGTHRTAILETLAIVIIGLSLGATGYLGTATQSASVSESTSSFFERIAISLYELVGSDTERVVLETESNGEMLAQTESAILSQELEPGIIVAPSESFTAEAVDSLRGSFSDPVEVSVDPENPDTGIIVPKFKSGDGEAFRFLMVPVITE